MLTYEEQLSPEPLSESSVIVLQPEWSDICRTCLKSSETQSLFEMDNESRMCCSDMIMQCANVIIHADDNLPNRICLTCIEELRLAFQFRKKCISSHLVLQSYLSSNRVDEKSTDVPLSVSRQSDLQEEIDIAIPLDSCFLYMYKPPSDMKLELAGQIDEAEDVEVERKDFHITETVETEIRDPQHHRDANMIKPKPESKLISDSSQNSNMDGGIHLMIEPCNEVKNEIIEYYSEQMNESDNAITMTNEMDQISYTHESENVNDGETILISCTARESDTEELFPEPEQRDCTQPNGVRTLRSIRKRDKLHDVKPTIETITTQPAIDGDGLETIIRIKRNRTTAKQVHACTICNTTYKYKHILQTHLRRHRGERPHKCEYCEKSFVVPFELQRHMRIHTGQKPYTCQFCDRSYSDFSSKTKHERTHTGERPYKCKYCCKTFAYSHVLNNHMHIHTGEKKYSCLVCGKRFTKSHHLKIHGKTHPTDQVNVRSSGEQNPENFTNKRRTLAELTDILEDSLIASNDESTLEKNLVSQRLGHDSLDDSYDDNGSRLVATGWTLADDPARIENGTTNIGSSQDDQPMASTSVVTLEQEELENVSIVSFSDYMMKTEGLEGIMTDETAMTVLLPKVVDSVHQTFNTIQIIDD
ncbi:zinc finger protein 239-like [Anopheles nili]|uniref:zinc finger protein 239-like n=1 Tax=Anopheles nili TaxID=185578 RepID=UPI00237BC5C8|nr:zinc finger protein 239-like [Anopheles nili]